MGCGTSRSRSGLRPPVRAVESLVSVSRVIPYNDDVPLDRKTRPLLQPECMRLVKSSWEEVCSEISKIGKTAFLNLWELHPNVKQFFSFYRDREYSEVDTVKALHKHGVMPARKMSAALFAKVLTVVGQCIRHIRHVEWIEQRLRVVGLKHTSCGVRQDQVDLLVPLIIDCMRRILKSADIWTPAIEDAWYQFFAFITHIIKENMGSMPQELLGQTLTITAPESPMTSTRVTDTAASEPP